MYARSNHPPVTTTRYFSQGLTERELPVGFSVQCSFDRDPILSQIPKADTLPELAPPKTATENVRVIPKSWSVAFPQVPNEIRVPLSPTDTVVAGKFIASILAGWAG